MAFLSKAFPGGGLSPAPSRGSAQLAAAGLVILGAWAYANSGGGPFVYDDLPSIVHNVTIRHLWPVARVLAPPADGSTVAGRPVLNLSLALNYAGGGTAVGGYHAANLLIHLLAGLALFGIVRRTLAEAPAHDPRRPANRPLLLAWGIAALWIVHPVQTEAVSYVIQRAESLMGLFYLLTLYGFIRGVASSRARSLWFGLAWLACLLGMATKEVMVTAPLLVLLYDRTFVAGSFREAWRRRKRLHLGLASTWILLGYLVVVVGGGNRNGSMGGDERITLASYLATQPAALLHYLRLSLWPRPLIFEYGPVRTSWAAAAPAAVAVALLLAGTAVALWRWPRQGFLGAWFFGILAPTSLVPGAKQMIVEHRLYLPLAAVIVALVLGADALLRTRASRRTAIFFGLGLVSLSLAGVTLTRERNRTYASAQSLWADTAAKRPGSAVAENSLAVELARQPGGAPEALERFEAALRVQPGYAEAHYNLALELTKIPGRLPEALPHYREAVRLRPQDPEARHGLANALLATPGGLAEALGEYAAAVSLAPDFAEAHNNYGRALASLPGREEEARAQYEAALRSQPDYALAHFNLANLLMARPGELPAAEAHYKEVLRLEPDFAPAHFNLAVACAQAGQIDDAIVHFEAALRLDPGLTEAREHLEALRAAAGGMKYPR